MKLRVLHSHPLWLPLTQTWLANLITSLPSNVESAVVCNRVIAGADKPACPHYVESHQGLVRHKWNRMLSRARVATRRTFRAQTAFDHQSQIVHSHFGHVGWQDMPLVAVTRAKHVVSFYGQDAGQLPQGSRRWRSRYRDLFAHVDAVLCEGPFLARRVAALGCDPERIHVHHLGIQLEQLALRPRLYNPGEPLRVLMAASFREKKGIPDGLRAIAAVARWVPVEVTIIGDANQEPEAQREKRTIMKLVHGLPSNARVNFLGYQPFKEVLRQAYLHHIFLHPSVTAASGDSEGGAPVAVMEMAATGMMVVSTRHCDIPEIVPHSFHHLLAAERDPADLVRVFRWLLEHPEQWRSIALNNRRHLERGFDEQRQGKQLAALYRHVLDGRVNMEEKTCA